MATKRFEVVKLSEKASSDKKALKGKFVELVSLVRSSVAKGDARDQAIFRLDEAYGHIARGLRMASKERA